VGEVEARREKKKETDQNIRNTRREKGLEINLKTNVREQREKKRSVLSPYKKASRGTYAVYQKI